MATDPVCGMAVEEGPEALRLARDNRTYYFCSADCRRSFAEPEEARRRLRARLAVAWPLAVATVALVWLRPGPYAPFVAGALAAVVQFYAGSGFYVGARDALRQRTGNMDLLVAVGTSAAFAYSAAVLAFPGRLPPATYFDASALIVTVILTGNYLEQLTRRSAGSALRRLTELLPTTALLVEAAGDRTVRRDAVAVGMRLRVRPRERFPADGLVRDGVSTSDESLLTGESTGVRKAPGDRVLAGARNLDGPLVVEVTHVEADTFVAQVGALLQEAELAKVPLQQRADRLAAWFAPFALTLAAAASVLWFVVTAGDLTLAVLVFVSVAVTACPCAFGLATPAALLVGTGRAAEDGILFRGGDSIERAAEVDTVLLDKTGTLTSSGSEVASVEAVGPAAEPEVLALAAGLEAGVDHPAARAVLRAAKERGVSPAAVESVLAEPGRGVSGRQHGRPVALLRGDAPEARGAALAGVDSWVRENEAQGRSWSVLLRDGVPLGALSFRAPIVPGAAEAVAALRGEGLRVAMVTGDSQRAAEAVARELGIEEVHAGVAPDGKVAIVRQYQGEGRRVAFVGDGVNDAAAIAAADLGIALGTGTEVTKEAGQLLLVRSDLRDVPAALSLARRIVGRVRRNLLWAIGYNAVLLPVAAGALVPLLGRSVYGYLPVLGAVAMGLSSTTVLLNSLSLRWPGRGTLRRRTAAAEGVKGGRLRTTAEG